MFLDITVLVFFSNPTLFTSTESAEKNFGEPRYVYK